MADFNDANLHHSYYALVPTTVGKNPLELQKKKVVRRQKRDRFVFQQLEMLLIFHFSMKF